MVFGVGSCANEVEDLLSFVSRSPPSIQVMIPCAIAARGENTMFKDCPAGIEDLTMSVGHLCRCEVEG